MAGAARVTWRAGDAASETNSARDRAAAMPRAKGERRAAQSGPSMEYARASGARTPAGSSGDSTERVRGRFTIAPKRLIVLMVVFALLCVPPVFVNTAIGYVPALFLVALVALSLAYGRICARGFVFDQMAQAASCVRGGSVEVLLRVRNESVLFVPRAEVEFAVRDSFGNQATSAKESIVLAPRETQDFPLTLNFDHLGVFEVGLTRIIVRDPLELGAFSVPADSSCSVAVTPRLREVDDIPLSDAAVKQVSEALRPSSLPGSDYCGVRDYVPGDPMKLIHWKLSARSEAYFTKLFEEQSEPSLDVFLDLSAREGDAEALMCLYDAAIETALSLQAYAQEKGLDTRLLFLNAEGEPGQFTLQAGGDFRPLMQRLPRAAVAPSGEFEAFLGRRATALQAADNIAVCSANCDRGLAEALARVKGTQRNVLLFALVSGSDDAQARKDVAGALRMFNEAGIASYAVDAGGGRS